MEGLRSLPGLIFLAVPLPVATFVRPDRMTVVEKLRAVLLRVAGEYLCALLPAAFFVGPSAFLAGNVWVMLRVRSPANGAIQLHSDGAMA